VRSIRGSAGRRQPERFSEMIVLEQRTTVTIYAIIGERIDDLSSAIADDLVEGWKFGDDGGSRRQRGWRGSEQPSQRQSRERLAFPRRGGGESCAYPKLSDSRPSSAQRAPVVPRLAAHVPSWEKPTTDCRREDCPSLKGIRAIGGRWEKREVRGTSKRG